MGSRWRSIRRALPLLAITVSLRSAVGANASMQEWLARWDAAKAASVEPIREAEQRAARADDPVAIWHEAAQSENPFVKLRAIREMGNRLDPRSIPVLDALAAQQAEQPPYRRDEGVFHYPTLAAMVARRVKGKAPIEAILEKTPAESQVEAIVAAAKRQDVGAEEFALAWLLRQPASEPLVEYFLAFRYNPAVEDYLVRMPDGFLSLLRQRLIETDDGDVMAAMATVFLRRKDKESVPFLVKSLSTTQRTGLNYGGARVAVVVAQLSDDGLLPEMERLWSKTDEPRVRNRYAIVCQKLASPKSLELLRSWRTETAARLRKMRAGPPAASAAIENEQDLLENLGERIRQLEEQKGVAP